MTTAEKDQDFLKDLEKKLWTAADKRRKSTSVDWQVRDRVRAKLRHLVRITLRRYKYPPDQQNATIELVLRQAEVFSEGWSASA